MKRNKPAVSNLIGETFGVTLMKKVERQRRCRQVKREISVRDQILWRLQKRNNYQKGVNVEN